MLRLLSVILILSLPVVSFAQKVSKDCSNKSKLYKDYERYIPAPEFPILSIKLNFVFLQRSDGCCGLTTKNPEHIDMINKTMDSMNKRYGNLKDPKSPECYDGDDFVPDTKIRFKLHKIIEIQDDNFYDLDKIGLCPNEGKWALNPLDSIIRHDPRYANAINIYFPNSLSYHSRLMNPEVSSEAKMNQSDCSQLPPWKDLDRSSKLNMADEFNKYWEMKNIVINDPVRNPKGFSWDDEIYYWTWHTMASGLGHELGHSLGLLHSNKHHGTNKCEYSIMHQKAGRPKNWLPPSEIGKIHRNLRMTNIRNFLSEEVYSPIPWKVTEDTDIDINYKAYEDIIVKKDQTLKVTCTLVMSPECQIILEEGATLDLSEGQVIPVTNMEWKGVRIKGKKCFLKKNKQTTQAIINPNNLIGVRSMK